MSIQLTYTKGMVFNTHYHRIYRNDDLGVQVEMITKRDKNTGMPKGKGSFSFYIDGDKTEYKSKEDLIEALKKIGRWNV
jgi:hypothetical protein